LEGKSFWFQSRNALLIWALRNYFPNARSFFEIGCGTGFVLSGVQQAFPRMTLFGSDIFAKGLSFAVQRLPIATLFQMDARHIPFEEEFDVIGAFDVLEHIEEDEAVLTQMFQATTPGGGIILTVPQHPSLWSGVDDYSFHKRRYSRRELVWKVEQAGFKLLRVTSFVFLLLPVMMLSRMMKRGKRLDFDSAAEINISSLLNEILEKVMDIERMAIEVGISFHLGGSLLVVAKR
jgi:SAM-dependent methyltransferase